MPKMDHTTGCPANDGGPCKCGADRVNHNNEVKRLTDSRQMYIESVLELEEQVKALTTERDTLMHERAVIVADHDEIARKCAELRAKVAGLEGRLRGMAAAMHPRCAECGGSGTVSRSYGYIPCPACDGKGH